MSAALLILPNFVLILVGLALARRFDYGRGFWEGLEKLVYYVLFPALLFRSLALAKIDFTQTGWLAAAACAFTVAGFLLSLLAKPIFNLDQQLHATGSQCGYRFSTYIGLAIAGSLFGGEGVALAALLLGVMIPLANFGAVAVLAAHSERGFLKELAQHPLVVSSLAGFAWNLAGLPLPGFADQTLALLGQTALPAGLLSVGAAMRFERGQGPVGAHAWWLAVKLVVVPAMAWALARALGLHGIEGQVLILCAALPTATNAYILAVRMTGDGRAVATQITAGTVFCMVTIPLWMAAPL
ncbi:MAG: AEC family transporter [Pseudomonadota bacterium]|nr:AEC family transporter [Pseudomonadota bacterium]